MAYICFHSLNGEREILHSPYILKKNNNNNNIASCKDVGSGFNKLKIVVICYKLIIVVIN